MADYNINAVTRRKVFTGSAGTGPYAFTFEILVNTDIVVYFNATKLTLTTDYTVAINANGTGSVTLVVNVAGNIPATPDADDTVIVIGARDIERTTDFVTAGDLLASSLNEQLDALTIFDQQIAEENQRGMRAPPYDPALVEDGGVVDMTLPAKASRAGKTLAFDSNGNPTVGEDIGNWRGDWAAGVAYTVRDLVKDPTNSNIYRVNTAHTSSGSAPISGNADVAKFDLVIDATAVADAEAAQAAAEAAQAAAEAAQTAAETAETNAETAEANAETAETNAETAQTAAETAQTAAETAQTAAETAETNAETSETNAAASETAAASSASSASTSAATATTQAGIATTKAGEASTSASNAATSETNAATSETNASTSASNAASSATSASSAQTAAEAARDAIQQFYLGAQSSNPTVDGNGDPVTAGDWYFNTGDNTTRIYNGSAWQITAIAAGDFLTVSNNLSDIASASTARTNLGLGSAATLTAGTSANNLVQLDGSAALPAVDGSALTGIAAIPMIDVWNLTSTHSNSGDITSGWARMNTDSPGLIGTGMSEASGIFTFPSTGIYMVEFTVCMSSSGSDATIQADIKVTTDNSTYSSSAQGKSETGGGKVQMFMKTLFDVTDTSTHKVVLNVSSFTGSLEVESGSNLTAVYFTKVGET